MQLYYTNSTPFLAKMVKSSILSLTGRELRNDLLKKVKVLSVCKQLQHDSEVCCYISLILRNTDRIEDDIISEILQLALEDNVKLTKETAISKTKVAFSIITDTLETALEVLESFQDDIINNILEISFQVKIDQGYSEDEMITSNFLDVCAYDAFSVTGTYYLKNDAQYDLPFLHYLLAVILCRSMTSAITEQVHVNFQINQELLSSNLSLLVKRPVLPNEYMNCITLDEE